MKETVYNQKGTKAGTVELPERVFGARWNADLVHQVVVAMQGNARTKSAHVKERDEVRGGGKKPWRQKGTGRARHGSSRSPIWTGGGVTHGPRNDRDYTRKINKKMKQGALRAVLSQKLRDGEVLFLDTLAFAAPKTKDAKGVLSALAQIKGFEKLATKKRNAAYIATVSRDAAVYKSFGNFGNVAIGDVRSLNPVQVLNHNYLIIVDPEGAIATLLKEAQTAEKVDAARTQTKKTPAKEGVHAKRKVSGARPARVAVNA